MIASHSIDWILQQSHNYPLLTAQQEIILARHVQAWLEVRDKAALTRKEKAVCRRGKRAFDTYYLSNIRLVVHVAKRYLRYNTGSLGFEDLIQEGLVGLERAIVKFDPTRGYKFSTYAFNWVRQAINRGLSNHSRTIRLPCHAIDMIKKASDYAYDYRLEHGISPTTQQLADYCECEVHTLKRYMRFVAPTVSLDEKCKPGDDEASTLLEMIADTHQAGDGLDDFDGLHEALPELINQLSSEDQLILQRRYMDPKGPPSFSTLAKELGCSRQAVTQRHERALRRLRLGLIRTMPGDTQELLCAA